MGQGLIVFPSSYLCLSESLSFHFDQVQFIDFLFFYFEWVLLCMRTLNLALDHKDFPPVFSF